jgi:glutaredoxin 2
VENEDPAIKPVLSSEKPSAVEFNEPTNTASTSKQVQDLALWDESIHSYLHPLLSNINPDLYNSTFANFKTPEFSQYYVEAIEKLQKIY